LRQGSTYVTARYVAMRVVAVRILLSPTFKYLRSRKSSMGERGQAWSMDLVIGVLIFFLAIGVIYTLLLNRNTADTTPLRLESEVVATKLTSDPALQVGENNVADPDRMVALAQRAALDYDQLKADLGVKNEVCIYLQDKDGNLIYLVNSTDPTKRYNGIGPGSNELNLSGLPCGSLVP
jgi:hypothetical protein